MEKIDIEERDNLFTITKTWFEDEEKLLHNRLGTLLIKLFVDVEKQQFERRLKFIIPLLKKQLDKNNFNNDLTIESEKFTDQYLVNLLNLFIKILNECKLFSVNEWTQDINELYGKQINRLFSI